MNESRLPTNPCWSNECLSKAGLFTWAMVQGCVLTEDRFFSLAYLGPSRCVLYIQVEESGDHLFLNCPFSYCCWLWLCAKLHWYMALPNNLLSLLVGWSKLHKGAIFNFLWTISPSLLIWEIWKERNMCIFPDKAMSRKSLLNKIEASILEIINSRVVVGLVTK